MLIFFLCTSLTFKFDPHFGYVSKLVRLIMHLSITRVVLYTHFIPIYVCCGQTIQERVKAMISFSFPNPLFLIILHIMRK
jgi:hypothetical protein